MGATAITQIVISNKTGIAPAVLSETLGAEGVVGYSVQTRGFRRPVVVRLTVDVDGQVYACPMLAESFQAFPDAPLRQRLIAMRLGDISDASLPARVRACTSSTGATTRRATGRTSGYTVFSNR